MSTQDRAPRLGRGLASLMGDLKNAPTGSATLEVEIDLLEINPFQPRTSMDPVALQELTASVRASGILQPLLIRRHPSSRERYQIVAGERRWRAAQAAGLHSVPVLVRDLSDTDVMAAALVENLQRQDLNAIEEAEGFRRLIEEFSLTQDQLGTAVGKSRSHIANTLRLLRLPQSVRSKVADGVLSAGHARALLGHADPEGAAAIVIARGLNVRQTEALTVERGGDPSSPKRPIDPETTALERELSERLGLKVEIVFNGTGGSVRLRYLTLEQLDGIVALLNAG